MYEIIFLFALALIYIIFAIVQDIKTREIADWLNFSMIIFALGFRFFYSLFSGEFSFFYQGIIGLGIFFILSEVFYHSHIFAGGDAKLMRALGPILFIYPDTLQNINKSLIFLLIFLFVSLFYMLGTSTFLGIKYLKEFKKEFSKQVKVHKKKIMFSSLVGLILLSLGFFNFIFAILSLFVFFLPYTYLLAKSIDEACMIKIVKSEKLTEGDWLYSDLKLGKKVLKAKWDGLTRKEISEIKRYYSQVKIRQGIAFSPTFLISFILWAVFILFNLDLWNSFW